MKNLNRETLLRDFGSAAFCLTMAFALLMMYSGCSEDNSPINGAHGGAAEEQGVYALAGRVGDLYPKLMQVRDSLESGSREHQTIENSIYAYKGAVVNVYELDSLTLEKTGRFFADTVDNDSGYFAFEQLTLSSPYVLIETLDSCYTMYCEERGLQYYVLNYYANDVHDSSVKYLNVQSAIVDLRKAKKISVNSLTTEKIPLVRRYFSDGMPFVAANKKAESNILESLGIYEDLGAFEDLDSEQSELPYIIVLKRNASYVKTRPFAPVLASWKLLFVYPPQSLFASFGNEIEQSFLNTKKLYNYLVEFFAHDANLGRCVESREGEMGFLKIDLNELSLVCRSGKWRDGFKKMEYTKGEMVDSRDGQKYKTVTYNFGNISQTWMAENLNFSDVESSKCWEHDPACYYGRLYKWSVVVDVNADAARLILLDTLSKDTVYNESYADFKEKFIEMKKYLDLYEIKTDDEEEPVKLAIGENSEKFLSVDSFCAFYKASYAVGYFMNPDIHVENGLMRAGGYCGAKYPDSIFTFYVDYMKPELKTNSTSYQGVCPDGWRIPNYQDWLTLIENVADLYGFRDEMRANNYRLGAILNDDYASGFGYTVAFGFSVGGADHREIVDFGYWQSLAVLPSLPFDDPDGMLLQTFFEFELSKWKGIGAHLYKSDFEYYLDFPVFVRCIKN